MCIPDDIEISLFSRVVIDPIAELTVVNPSPGDSLPPIFRPVDIHDEEGRAWFGPGAPFPDFIGVSMNDARLGQGSSNPFDIVFCVVNVKHEHLVVKVPVTAIQRVLGPDDEMPASIHPIAMRIFGLRRAETPIFPPELPALATLEIHSLARDVRTALAMADAAEIHWLHRGAVFVWAERGLDGWSVYRNNFGLVTYWCGPDSSPPALRGACIDPAYDLFRLINSVLVGEASFDSDALDGPERLVVLDADHRAPRQEAEWDESFLWMVLPWRTTHF